MIFIIHILRWVLKFIKFPIQFLKLFFADFRDDLKNNKIFRKNKFVFIIGLPKSGTTMVEQILRSLGYIDQSSSPLRIFDNRNLKNPHDISENMFKKVPKKKLSFLKLHTHFSEDNLNTIEKYNPKVIITLRDLKDVLISRFNHIISDPNHRHYYNLTNLEYNEGFKKSLLMKNSKDTPVRPLDYFYFWIKDWKKEIEKRNLDFLVLNYENYNLNKKKYIKSILDYLDINDVNIDNLLIKINSNYDKIKKNNLEKNLKKYIKPQTFNKDSENIKRKLKIREIEDFIIKNLPEKNDNR
jgi:hypothetical protein